MAHSHSIATLIGILVIGLIIGGAGVYFGARTSPSTVSITQSTTITTTVTTAMSSSSSASGPTMAQFLGTLKNSSTISMNLKSFDFGKGTLGVWVVNNGTAPIVISPAVVTYNGTTSGQVIAFSYIDPTVTRVGVYAYIPIGSEIFVSVIPSPIPLQGQKATLQIVNLVFTFTYGTSG